DHWGHAASLLFAGAGARGGLALGQTDKQGAYVTKRPVAPADVAYTIFDRLGIDPRKMLQAPDGRPQEILDAGEPIGELVLVCRSGLRLCSRVQWVACPRPWVGMGQSMFPCPRKAVGMAPENCRRPKRVHRDSILPAHRPGLVRALRRHGPGAGQEGREEGH